MASNIDPTKPTHIRPQTADVRSNFLIAKDEIEELQNAIANQYKIITLSPTDLGNLSSYPGITLLSSSALGLSSNQVLVVTSLEFSLTFNSAPYTTSANLYLNYAGNYLTGAQLIPVGNTSANNNVGMLTASRNIYRYVQSTIADGDFPPQQDVILMSNGAILGGDSDLRIKVSYLITTLF